MLTSRLEFRECVCVCVCARTRACETKPLGWNCEGLSTPCSGLRSLQLDQQIAAWRPNATCPFSGDSLATNDLHVFYALKQVQRRIILRDTWRWYAIQISVFINKACWHKATHICLFIVCGSFCYSSRVELLWQRPYGWQNLRYLCLPLDSKSLWMPELGKREWCDHTTEISITSSRFGR